MMAARRLHLLPSRKRLICRVLSAYKGNKTCLLMSHTYSLARYAILFIYFMFFCEIINITLYSVYALGFEENLLWLISFFLSYLHSANQSLELTKNLIGYVIYLAIFLKLYPFN